MRTLSHQWRDRKPFTRRVRWYCANLTAEGRRQNIRLEFDDNEGVARQFYRDDYAAAEQDYRAFQDGTIGTAEIRHRAAEQRQKEGQ